MKRTAIFSILLVSALLQFGQNVNAQDFNTFFKDKTLRIDFHLRGTHDTTQASIAQLKEEKYWGGSVHHTIFPDYGTYRVQLFDAKSKQLIFSKGFNPLFKEWQTTNEAKEMSKIYYHTIQVPYPKAKVTVKIEERNWEGKFQTVLEQNIDPKSYFIINEKPKPYKVVELLKNGEHHSKIDLAILAEGYTAEEMDEFKADAQRMIDYMFTIPPFDRFKNRFNVYAILCESEESGTDVPGKHIYKNTILNSSFYTFDSPRYLTTSDMKAVADVAAVVPYDQVYVLVNSATYGGGGFYNYLNLTSADHALSEKVFVHEFGHGFVGLADEYYTSSTSYNDFYNLKVEPWEPNITTLVNFESKWKNMIDATTPIPTPRNGKYVDQVGVFEGGGYSAKGIYSPVQDCRMKSNEPEGFCPVCQKAIEATIKLLTE
ncbi:peptidase [Prolixibacteraceae bacterium JC049]|nr:peptidase [Prolixibacteraceae bacterium JC049]